MGRFDALNQLDEEKQETKPKTPVPHSPTSKKIDTEGIATEIQNSPHELKDQAYFEQSRQRKQDAEAKKPANPQARKTAIQSSSIDSSERPEKYTTRLKPSLVKKVRLHA